jgi:SP family facilitated glucose transporter-like MFS transporter 1
LKYLSIAFVYIFVVFFAIGPGTVPWIILPEIFAQGARPAATSVAVMTNWLSNFAVGLIFPILAVRKIYFGLKFFFFVLFRKIIQRLIIHLFYLLY